MVKENNKEKDIALLSKVEELSAVTEVNRSQIAGLIEKVESHENNLNEMVYTAESQKQEFDYVKEQQSSLNSEMLKVREKMNYMANGLNDTRQMCEWQCSDLKEVKSLVVNQGENLHDFKEELATQKATTDEITDITARNYTELNIITFEQKDIIERLLGSVDTMWTLVDRIREGSNNRAAEYMVSSETASYSSVDTVQLLLSEVPFLDASDMMEDDFSCGFIRNDNILTDVSNTPQRMPSNYMRIDEVQDEYKENILWSTTSSLIEKFNPRRF